MPNNRARGRVRPGSRTSPAILPTSHHPPKEKNAPTTPTPSAGANGNDPGRCATKGAKFDHDPSRKAKAQIVRKPSRPSLSQVVHRRNAALTRILTMFIDRKSTRLN